MTLEDLNSLIKGDIVIIIKIDEFINSYNLYNIGDELKFIRLDEFKIKDDFFIRYNFIRSSKIKDDIYYVECYFTKNIYRYIERKTTLERDNKLKELGID